jgi:sugar phosphate isomerase/epimerase
MAVPYRFAICNELFQKFPFREACKQARAIGYQGLEIAPFTLAEDPGSLTFEQRTEIRRSMEDEGLRFVGLHWLLVSPAGLHVSTRDEAVRRRTWDHVHRLIDLCTDLAGCQSESNGVLVFGSPKQRSTTDGMSVREATDVFTHELAHAAPHAESCGVKILVEALPADQSDVVNSLAEAVCIVKQIGSPAIQTMFDTHNAVDEKDTHASLVRRYFPYIRHVHVNEMDGREPGMGDYDFAALLRTLAELDYSGWVSLEAFDFSRDAHQIAQRALEYLRNAARASVLTRTATA